MSFMSDWSTNLKRDLAFVGLALFVLLGIWSPAWGAPFWQSLIFYLLAIACLIPAVTFGREIGFDSLVGGSVQVTRQLEDGDEIDLGDMTLQVIFTPGHSPGSISLFCPQDGTLLTGDAIPPTNGLPLYYHLAESRQSLQRLARLQNVKTMYHSHLAQPFTGPDIAKAFQDGLAYLDQMDEAVSQAKQSLAAEATIEEITRATLIQMGFDPPPVMPLTMATVKAHLG